MAVLNKTKLGEAGYINPNCWVAKSIKGPPYERCKYCTISDYKKCPIFKYLIITIILVFFSLGGAFLIDKKFLASFFKIILFTDLIFSVAYGFFFEKVTIEVIKKDYEVKKILETKIKERTKELEELTNTLDKKVKQKTKELEQKVNDLEKFKKLTIGRELKMIDLKKKLSQLKTDPEKTDSV